MAKVISHYIPFGFRRKVKWISPEQRGKVIDLTVSVKKSA